VTRKRLATFGRRGKLVRLFLETRMDGVKRYVVMWGPKGARQQDSWPATKEGKAEAEAFFAAYGKEMTAKPERAPVTNRELFVAFKNAEWAALRPRSRTLYEADWRTWEQFAGAANVAEETSVIQCGEFRKALDARGLATATLRTTIGNIRTVFNWGERMELLQKNKWHLFVLKIAKDKRTKPRAEYRSDEFLRIWAALDPQDRGQWRAWVAIGLLGIYGNRQNEILNLQWGWIEGDVVSVPLEYVKTGEDRALRLFPQTQRILSIAREWRDAERYSGQYVLFPGRRHNKELHYSIQSLTNALHLAEQRAGVESIRWRAGHGFRRGLMGDLTESTGDVTLALQAIGDRDLSMANSYRVRRNDRVDDAVRGRADRLFPESAESAEPKEPSE